MRWLTRIRKIETQEDYLLCLGRHLLWRLPFPQVWEILADYREYFLVETGWDTAGEETSENGRTSVETAEGTEKRGASGEIEALMEKWGTPGEVARKLLEENPGAGFDRRILWTGLWGALLLISFYGLFFAEKGLLLSLLLWSVSAFGFLHGRERTRLEMEFKGGERLPGGVLALHVLLPLLVMFLEIMMQYLLRHVQAARPDTWLPVSVGTATDSVCGFFQLLFALLFLWMFLKTATSSIRYLPLGAHACGAMLFIRGIRACLHSMDLSTSGYEGQDFLHALGYYGAGVALFVLFGILCQAPGLAWGKRGSYGRTD